MRKFIHGAMIGMGTLFCLTMYLNWGDPIYMHDHRSALPIAWYSYDYTAIDHDFLEGDVPIPQRKHKVKDDGYTDEQREFMNALVARYNK